MMNVNTIDFSLHKIHQQSSSVYLEFGTIFSEWSDIVQTAFDKLYTLADDIYFSFDPVAARFEEAKSARRVIEELARLEENWDGYGASSISQQACGNALSFISLIESAPYGVPLPEICPTPNGTISFGWGTPHAEVYIEIGNTRYSGFITIDQQQPIFFEGHAASMDEQIISLIQRAISLSPAHPSSVTEISQAPKHERMAP